MQLPRILLRTAFAAALSTMTPSTWADDSARIPVDDSAFKCLQEMKPVRGFFVANLLGKLNDTVRVATSPTGGRYPPGSVVQLLPTQVMVKHNEGWNPATKDWEFFELDVSNAGSKIKVRGAIENCLGCHVAAKPEWDLICEEGHGCAPPPITAERIVAIQKADPRCKTDAANLAFPASNK